MKKQYIAVGITFIILIVLGMWYFGVFSPSKFCFYDKNGQYLCQTSDELRNKAAEEQKLLTSDIQILSPKLEFLGLENGLIQTQFNVIIQSEKNAVNYKITDGRVDSLYSQGSLAKGDNRVFSNIKLNNLEKVTSINICFSQVWEVETATDKFCKIIELPTYVEFEIEPNALAFELNKSQPFNENDNVKKIRITYKGNVPIRAWIYLPNCAASTDYCQNIPQYGLDSARGGSYMDFQPGESTDYGVNVKIGQPGEIIKMGSGSTADISLDVALGRHDAHGFIAAILPPGTPLKTMSKAAYQKTFNLITEVK
ncbi:hypothetical protein HY989_02335 [Candidatus Micrarchaeota archaeon]|nr:hypothetical protein [Candidatus Micrarchaeota archaeon]